MFRKIPIALSGLATGYGIQHGSDLQEVIFISATTSLAAVLVYFLALNRLNLKDQEALSNDNKEKLGLAIKSSKHTTAVFLIVLAMFLVGFDSVLFCVVAFIVAHITHRLAKREANTKQQPN